ncbi:MAG: MFS transporter [Clostridia bacterium]|nr:MFS transporter [Clostridia bacterium]
MKPEIKKAWQIGVISIVSYLANYYLRNMLGVLTPEMLSEGVTTKTFAGLLSSTYMLTYAIGQLFNGVLGDMVNPKYMVLIGLGTAGAASIAFPFAALPALQIACFALMGYTLSMMRGPLVKIISENTEAAHARIICVFFSFASFAGPLCASLFAIFFSWNWAFVAAGAAAILLAFGAFFALTALEKRKIIRFSSVKSKGFGSFLRVFRIEKFGFYMLIACLVEISAIAIYFWIPTFLTEELGFEETLANTIYSGISTARAFVPFAALFIFRLIKERDILMMRISFALATLFFLLMLPANHPWLIIGLMLMALLCISCSSALLWSVYIPSLGKTGLVSSVNGILDCAGYAAAALANYIFAQILTNISWNGVILLWGGIALIGVIGTFFVRTKKDQAVICTSKSV